MDFQNTTLIDYFKAVAFAGDKLRERGKISDNKVEDVLRGISKEVKDNFNLDENRSRDAVDDAYTTLKNKKKISSSTYSVGDNILYLESRMENGRF